MTSTQKRSRIISPILLLLAVALAGCPANDNNLGSDADGGSTVTCQQGGTTYQPGQTVTLSACTTCVCLADGQVGRCTGLCAPDAATAPDATATCERNGITYQVGETVVLSSCTSCVCQANGQLGLCTGACAPDAAVKTDAKVTCDYNGVTYQVGETAVLSACGSCVCQASGQLGLCTGACPAPADAGAVTDAASSPSALCTSTGGQVTSSTCCSSASDFPNLCAIGACSCGPGSTHSISTCSCPTGGCFDPAYGCVGSGSVCTPGSDQTCNSNAAVSSIHGVCLSGGRCACKAPYTLLSTGKCS